MVRITKSLCLSSKNVQKSIHLLGMVKSYALHFIIRVVTLNKRESIVSRNKFNIWSFVKFMLNGSGSRCINLYAHNTECLTNKLQVNIQGSEELRTAKNGCFIYFDLIEIYEDNKSLTHIRYWSNFFHALQHPRLVLFCFLFDVYICKLKEEI